MIDFEAFKIELITDLGTVKFEKHFNSRRGLLRYSEWSSWYI